MSGKMVIGLVGTAALAIFAAQGAVALTGGKGGPPGVIATKLVAGAAGVWLARKMGA